ncbi:unnamed protein product [Prorocentrum cordatum]|uniref:Uncharacterized protein n=1 Tax=Prorocentrum cordatum TaxID=2364126 RepID=A0ABN9V8Z0_9DINO|nr:unnamed protein product [Polarella glacialis]
MDDWSAVSWMPLSFLPVKLGWKTTCGQRKRSLPTVTMFPSRELLRLLPLGLLRGGLHLGVEATRDVAAEFLLDVAHDLSPSQGGGRVATSGEEFHQGPDCTPWGPRPPTTGADSHAAARGLLAGGHRVRHAAAGTHNDEPCCAARSAQREHCLERELHRQPARWTSQT